LKPFFIDKKGTDILYSTIKMKYTIKFLGEGGVGKTCWTKQLKYIDFEKRYFGTVGCEMHPCSFNTNYGMIHLTISDYYGQEKYKSPTPICNTDATILMFDLSRTFTHTKLSHWHELCGTEPVIVVGNKNDVESVVNPTYHMEHNLPYVAVSAKTGTIQDLLIPILRLLTGHDDIVLTNT
jgi:GTPase SAR1 family protein